MTHPPLDIVALFSDVVPAGLSLTVDGAPPFDARRLGPPIAPFIDHLADVAQPLTRDERRAAESAQAGLALRCAAHVPPTERLPAAVELVRRCCAHGAVALVLPAAQKIIGRSAMAALAPRLDDVDGRLELFVQVHSQHAWAHTHGMEHLGLPDLECRTALADAAVGERLIVGCIHHLMRHGTGAISVGDFIAAEDDDGLLSRFWIDRPRDVADHRYGAYGALQLVPDQRPYDAEGNLMDALEYLASVIAANGRARDLDLRNAALTDAELSHLSADRLDFGAADLSGAKLMAARLGNCRLDGATLEEADCSGATLRQCTLDGVRGAGARFDNARIEDSSAKGADLSRASLHGARLTETSFARAVLREAALDGAEGDGVEFRGADLSRACMERGLSRGDWSDHGVMPLLRLGWVERAVFGCDVIPGLGRVRVCGKDRINLYPVGHGE